MTTNEPTGLSEAVATDQLKSPLSRYAIALTVSDCGDV